jgi:hypothetical protein
MNFRLILHSVSLGIHVAFFAGSFLAQSVGLIIASCMWNALFAVVHGLFLYGVVKELEEKVT